MQVAANRLRTGARPAARRTRASNGAEREAAWLAEHDALKRERDALAEELREVYQNAVAQIVDLFVRITANDQALSKLHRARPAGMKQHLLSAELHARGLDSFTRDTPSLLTSVCLFLDLSKIEAGQCQLLIGSQRLQRARVCDDAGPARISRSRHGPSRLLLDGKHQRPALVLRRSIPGLTHSPINASLAASRPHAHDSGPVWLATPSL